MISIVEDDASMRDALAGFVRSLGYQVRSFGSAEAYLAVRDGRCACLITDIELPGIDGIEMMAELTALGYEIPVIVITARSTIAGEGAARAAGALCYLTKPFEMTELIDCLDRALAA
ncbi:MAG: response regulator transcription factor [Tsuneonella sp.]